MNELMLASNEEKEVTAYCSMKVEEPEDKAKLFNIAANPDCRISDYINKTICVKDIYCEMVDVVNNETGEVTKSPRVILIDEFGVSYQAVSYGIYNAVKRLMGIYGPPTWEPGINLEILQIKKGQNNILTFKVV